jgi:hypothetical protein
MKMTQSAQTERPGGGTVLGFPHRGFGLFTSLLLALPVFRVLRVRARLRR